jgi:membrane protein
VRLSIVSTLIHRAGLTGSSTTVVRGAFASASDTRRATGILGLVFTFFYVNSFTTALRRVYTKAWRRPPGGRVSGYAVGVGFLAGLVAYFAVLGGLRYVFGHGPETALFAVMALIASIAVWLLTPWLMLQRQVRLRPLLTGAVMTGVAMSVYAATASLWMPHTVSENQRQFGFFGVALALVTWLSGAATIIVVSACAAPVLAEDTGWIGRLARGSDSPALLVAGAEPSFPAPTRAMTLRDAIGANRDEDDEDDD